jgi:magnesium transporter
MQGPAMGHSSRRNRARAAPSPLDSEVLHGIRAVQTAVNVNQTLGEALDDLRARSIDSPAIYVYAVDDDDRLVGQVPTRALLFSPPSTRVRDVMRADLVTIPLDTSFDDALGIFGRTKLLALPVVDAEGRLVGALDVERYASETLARSERDRVRQVFQTLGLAVDARDPLTPVESFRMRVPWLFCNIGGGVLCALVAWLFEDLLAKVVMLAFFLPLVLTLAESVAMQSLTITVGEGTLDGDGPLLARALRRLRGEAAAAILLGVACGAAVGVVGGIGGGGAAGAATMAAAVLASMLGAAIMGALIPIVLHARRLDPQVAAGPIALVFADVSATAIYFGLGLAFLMPSA